MVKLMGELGWLAFLAVVFIAAVLVVNPVGDFSLNDDFNYAFSARTLAETGRIAFPYLPSPTMIFQVFFGAFFMKVLGLSYTALRVSTLLMAFLAVASSFFIMRELGFGSGKSFLAALLLLFNPLFFSLSFSFMTDVHFVALMLLSALFYIIGFKGNRLFWLFLGSVFSVFAFLVRQNGVLIPVAALAYLLVRDRRLDFRRALVVFAFPLALMAAYMYWYVFLEGTTQAFSGMVSQTLSLGWLPYIPFRLFAFFEYIGIFLFPLSVSLFAGRAFRRGNVVFASAFMVLGLAGYFALLYLFHLGFPQLPNYINQHGLGPSYLQGLKSPDLSSALPIIGLFGIVSASFLAAALISARGSILSGFSSIRWLVFILGLLLFGFLFVLESYFDRYLLPVLLPAIAVAFYASSRFRVNESLLALCIVLLAVFSVAATHDYLSWNRAKMDAIGYLHQQGVGNINIDGGYEFDCQNFCLQPQPARANSTRDYDPVWVKHSVYVIDTRYVVAFSPVPNYVQVRKFGYFSLLTMRDEGIYALRRSE